MMSTSLCLNFGTIWSMVKINIKYFMWLLCSFSVVIFFGFFMVQGHNIENCDYKAIIGDLSKTVLCKTVLTTLFVSFAWRWKIFRGWLIPIPDISGKWEGILISTYTTPAMEIPTTVEISQTFFNTIVRIQTNESKSVSKCASFDIDTDRGVKHIYYTYVNNPKPEERHRSDIHYGTTLLEISDDNQTLSGEYWTSRKTTGSITLHKCE